VLWLRRSWHNAVAILSINRVLQQALRDTSAFGGASGAPSKRSFWMMLKLSSIVIMNLIANLAFLYHKLESHALTRPA